MQDENLLDDFDFEEGSTGELLTVAGDLSKWLRPMAAFSIVIGLVFILSGGSLLLHETDVSSLFNGLILVLQGAAWWNAARWQVKFMHWTNRVSVYDTTYDQEHWVYLNYRLWQWLAICLISSVFGVFLLAILGL